MNAHQFQNALRIMNSLDEVSDVLEPHQVAIFHADPMGASIRMDDPTFARVFDLIDRRMDPLIYDWKKALSTLSYTRAGWDFPDNPPAQKKAEADAGASALQRARSIWRDNPGRRGQLVAAFKALGPLATLDEVQA